MATLLLNFKRDSETGDLSELLNLDMMELIEFMRVGILLPDANLLNDSDKELYSATSSMSIPPCPEVYEKII